MLTISPHLNGGMFVHLLLLHFYCNMSVWFLKSEDERGGLKREACPFVCCANLFGGQPIMVLSLLLEFITGNRHFATLEKSFFFLISNSMQRFPQEILSRIVLTGVATFSNSRCTRSLTHSRTHCAITRCCTLLLGLLNYE